MDQSEADPGSSPGTRLEASSNGASLQQTVEAVDRNTWLKGVLATLSVLREWFPIAFAAGRPRPLKVGIDKDIAERAPAITDVERARALHYHTKSDRYLRSMRSGAPRIDLDGAAVGAVTDDDAAYARALLDAHKAKKAARLAAEQPQAAPIAEPDPQPPPPPPPAPLPAPPQKAKQQRELEQALKDRERYRQARGLGRRA